MRLLLAVFFSLCFASAARCDVSPAAVPYDVSAQGRFVTALCRDTQGCLWLGNEDGAGLWKYNPNKKLWTHFPASADVPDNTYALCCDKQGRIWAGSLDKGVSVWNGGQWKRYDATTGPLGSRVFALAVCPTDGDVWMATDAGLARWSAAKDTWHYYTRADGLASDQASCLAFDHKGNLFVGTMCDGLTVGNAQSDYTHWRTVTGWEPMPLSPGGDGLPSNLISALLVAKNGTVYVGTTHGLAHSSDGGQTWRFLRGEDWQAQGNGLYKSATLIPTDTKGHLLLEDYVNALAEDSTGNLYIGYRTRGYEVVAPSGQRLSPGPEGQGQFRLRDRVCLVQRGHCGGAVRGRIGTNWPSSPCALARSDRRGSPF